MAALWFRGEIARVVVAAPPRLSGAALRVCAGCCSHKTVAPAGSHIAGSGALCDGSTALHSRNLSTYSVHPSYLAAGTAATVVVGCASARTRRRGRFNAARWRVTSAASVAVAEKKPDESVADPSDNDPELERKFWLVRSVGEECQTEKELRNLLQKKPNFILYDGFEPSGRMHIAQGIYKSICVNKCTEAGGTFVFWVADWFALMNDKMGGDIDKIRTVGEYLIEVWKASGMDMSRVKFLWSSDEITKNAEQYWGQALDIACRSTLARVTKCCQIMGRQEDKLTAAQILYPIMQCADVFFLKADICQLGVDQRKVNMLARDYCDSAGRKLKPVVLSHHMLYGLKKGQPKMSKSDPDSAIFMEDTADEVQRKINQAYCPSVPESAESPASADEAMSLVEDDLKNPCLDYIRYVLFQKEGFIFTLGGRSFTDFDEVQRAFVAGEISEQELKDQLISDLNILLEPVRQHFTTDPKAKGLLEKVTQWKKETLTPSTSLTRLDLPVSNRAERTFVVFAPPPEEHVRVASLSEVLMRLRQGAHDSQNVVLWLPDWSSRAEGRLGGSPECIKAYYQLFLEGLRTLAPEGLMDQVSVAWQGESILTGPSEYWTSVINVGRRSSLESIRNAMPDSEVLDGAGQVVASIMHVGDVLSLASEDSPLVLCCSGAHAGRHRLAVQHLEQSGLPAPEVVVLDSPALRLRAEGEGTEVDANLLIKDMDADVNKKIKKAFCEPGNVQFCPPLEWVESTLLPLTGSFVVARKPENGGDLNYAEASSLRADFASGALHPGDLKPSLGKALNGLLAGVRESFKANKDLKQAQKKLDQYVKSQQKKAKK